MEYFSAEMHFIRLAYYYKYVPWQR